MKHGFILKKLNNKEVMRKENQEKWDVIFNDDIFKQYYKVQSSPQKTNDNAKLIENFEKVNDFVRKTGREPQKVRNLGEEYDCYNILRGLRKNKKDALILKEYDKHNLLDISPEIETPKTIDDILNDDIFSLLDSNAESIFDIRNVSTTEERKEIEIINEHQYRKKCKDFSKFKPLFDKCHEEINNKEREIISFREKTVQEGAFFVLGGVMIYLEYIGKLKKGSDGKMDGRTRIIFENGMESRMMLRSLIKRLYENGFSVTFTEDNLNEVLLNNMSGITKKDKPTGYIYVLKSLSNDLRISEIRNLYKIGFTENDVENRIANAKNEPTYLMADVRIEAKYKCFNLDTKKFELIIQKLFGNSCLNIDIFDSKGLRHSPREWFIVPLKIINQAIELIIKEDIIGYYYDNQEEILVKK